MIPDGVYFISAIFLLILIYNLPIASKKVKGLIKLGDWLFK